ncbi:MAG: hypothetical protein HYS74_01795 [Parcubacteria group bacterium]|nr:hypothetical protein [Parcubacteria group bacterium]
MTQEQRELLHVTVAAERNVPDKLLVRGRWRPEHWDTGEAEVAGLPHTGVPSLWTGLQDAGYVPRLVEWDKMEDSAAGRSRYRFTVVFSNDEGHPVAQFMENKKAVEEVRRVIETCAGFCWAWDNRRSQVPTVTVNLAGCQMTVMPKHKIVVKSEELKAVRA